MGDFIRVTDRDAFREVELVSRALVSLESMIPDIPDHHRRGVADIAKSLAFTLRVLEEGMRTRMEESEHERESVP